MARRRSSFVLGQWLFVWGLAALVLGGLGYFGFLALQGQPLTGFVAGEHYQLAERPRRVRGPQVEVLEFFSYGCIHCYRLDGDLDAWVAEQGDAIRFQRLPLGGSAQWRLLARAWFAMQALELDGRWHQALFREIHDRRQPLNTQARLEAFFAEGGVAPADFRRAFKAPEVQGQVDQAERLARRLQVASVPTLVIQGQYLVGASRATGLRRLLDIASHLVEKVSLAAEQQKQQTQEGAER